MICFCILQINLCINMGFMGIQIIMMVVLEKCIMLVRNVVAFHVFYVSIMYVLSVNVYKNNCIVVMYKSVCGYRIYWCCLSCTLVLFQNVCCWGNLLCFRICIFSKC